MEKSRSGNEKVFLKCLKERLIDTFRQDWIVKVQNRSETRYSLYSKLKSELYLSTYLCEIKHVQAKSSITRLRLGVSHLNTHYNRFKSNPSLEDLECPFCKDVMENEVHFLFCCPMYNDLRDKYIDYKYVSRPSEFRLSVLLASESKTVMSSLGWFCIGESGASLDSGQNGTLDIS